MPSKGGELDHVHTAPLTAARTFELDQGTATTVTVQKSHLSTIQFKGSISSADRSGKAF